MCVTIWPRLRRLVSVLGLVFVLAVMANAYTVVMRDGRRIEIPAQFFLTPSTLTYEVSPGVQITIQLAAIDVTATEKANGDKPGALLNRASSASSRQSSASVSVPVPARRTITNRDLESTAQRRLASELAYEKRRKELGLPSIEESRRRAAEESAELSAQLQQSRALQSENEGYWRQRASALRSEITSVDAELSFVRRQLEESPYSNSFGTASTFTTVLSGFQFGVAGNFGRGRAFGTFHSRRPGVFVTPAAVPRVLTHGHVFQNPLGFPHGRRFGGSLSVAPNLTVFSSPLAYDFSYERGMLITRFNQLAATRAGLNARWRELEDEARRAGAQPGWLR